MAKKKQPGHYCKICGERKANEKFTGKGHAAHICKACQSLPATEQTGMKRLRDVERLFGKYPLSRQDWELLEKYAKKYARTEVGACTKEFFDSRRVAKAENSELPAQPYSDFDEEEQDEITEIIYDEVCSFIIHREYIPEKTHRQKIRDKICYVVQREYGVRMQPDEAFESEMDEITQTITEDWESDGEEIPAYADTLVVLETERLLLHKFDKADLPSLHAMMEKQEVMYAWEHGFTKTIPGNG